MAQLLLIIIHCFTSRQLAQFYPSFPSMEEFSQTLMSLKSIGNIENPCYIISQFTLEYPRLKAGGALLPDLIKLYWWIHTELAYRVTREYAEKHSIEEILTRLDKKYPDVEVFKLYERVRGMRWQFPITVGREIVAIFAIEPIL